MLGPWNYSAVDPWAGASGTLAGSPPSTGGDNYAINLYGTDSDGNDHASDVESGGSPVFVADGAVLKVYRTSDDALLASLTFQSGEWGFGGSAYLYFIGKSSEAFTAFSGIAVYITIDLITLPIDGRRLFTSPIIGA